MIENTISIRNQITREFLDILFYRFHFLLIGESCGAILYVFVMWKVINHSLLLTWLAAVILINGLLRHYMTYQYFRANTNPQNMKLSNDPPMLIWHTRFVVTALIAGIIWGAGASFILLVDNEIYRVLIVLWMYAVIGVGNITFLPDRRSHIAFLSPICISLIICLLTFNERIYNVLSFAILLQLVLSINLTRQAARVIIQSLVLRFKNTNLLHKINLSKRDIEATNIYLNQENEAIYKAEISLHQLATHDQLTNLPNRHLLVNRLAQAIERSKREHTRVAVLFVDLDHFKRINDSMGHDVGDKLLIEAAQRMRYSIRQTDIIARLSGDEFCIALTNINDPAIIINIAKKILNELRHPINIDNHHFGISASIGISVYPDNSDNPEKLMKNADLALYQAKDKGRNQFVIFNHVAV